MPDPVPSSPTQQIPINNGTVPQGSPKVIPWSYNFTAITNTAALLDITQLMATNKIAYVQSVFVDNSENPETLSITCSTTNQQIVIPGKSQATCPIFAVNTTTRFLVETAGTAVVNLFFANVALPVGFWSSEYTTPPFSFDPSTGALIVSDPILDGTVSGGAVTVNITNPVTLTDVSVTSPGTPASGQLVVANPSRQYLSYQAPASGVFWINPTGGSAGPSLTGCFLIPPGTIYESTSKAIVNEITYYYSVGGTIIPVVVG